MSRRSLRAFAAALVSLVAVVALSRAVPADATPTDVFFSEYVEGSSNNKALEIYNGTGAPVNLFAGGYRLEVYFNGATSAGMTISLLGTVANGDVYVVAPTNAGAAILAAADQTFGTAWFNGDDAVVLRKTPDTIVDVIGQVGVDPGTEWGTGLTSTADNTIRRKNTIEAGDTNSGDSFDPSVQWDGFATDTFDGLGFHSTVTGDDPPTVTGLTPVNGATNVAVDSNATVTFSEPVNVTGAWYSISCGTSGAHTATVSGGPTAFTLNPDSDFANGETCSVTVNGGQVSDQDSNDPPDTVAGNPSTTFTTAAAPLIVVSQVYGGGGNAGATLKQDFIELFNRGTGPVNLGGWSVQYASATGTSWQVTNLSNVTLHPQQYYLVQEAQGAGGTVDLPAPDATGTIAMSATAGKVALVRSTTALTGGCPTGGTISDFVGYGSTASCFEGSGPTAGLTNTTAALRNGGGCVDTDNNAADFTVGSPNPRNTASPFGNCNDQPPSVSSTNPASGASGVALDSNVSITFSEPVNVTGAWYSIVCASSGSHTASASGGPTTFTLDPTSDFVASESCTVTVVGAQVSDQDTTDPPDTMTADHVFSFTTAAPPVRIHDIQGAGHTAAILGPVSGVTGTVTAKRSNGYYMQDPSPDANDATSEAIFVFTSSAPSSVNVGDAVSVSGNVVEFRPGGSSSTNLTITEISGPTTTVNSSGNPLPAPVTIGTGDRIPPTEVIEDDAAGSVETSGVFDPATDGIDFYESMEAMRVQVDSPVVVGPRNSFGEVWVLPNNGAYAGIGVRTARNGIVIRDLGSPFDYQSGDFNPEKIQFDDAVLAGSTPNANVGDGFTTSAIGILDYDFGNFEIELTSALTRVDNGLQREVTADSAARELAVATFNVENLDANEPQSKFDALAGQIVNNMRSPDVVSLEEIQDNNGATNDSVVDADQTLNKLVTAIQNVGGPTYDWRQINPVDDQDGGEPGGNIRVGFIFRTDRGLAFVDRPGGGSTTPTTVVSGPGGPQLSASPGRVDPTNPAWNASRKPLAGEFTYRGETFFLITNHFNSKGGDNPLFGRFQPPVRTTETQRHQQANIVNNFVDQILAADANANVVVLGDINDFEFSQTMANLEGGVLHALMSTLPQNERYSYVFEGNSQSLDHIVVSSSLFGNPFAYDPVHVNAEFHDQLSDHDPQVALFYVNTAPTADAGGPYTVAEGGSVAVGATGSDANGDALTYAWDLDNNGTFETSGQNATFSAAGLDGPSTHTIAVRVSDGDASTTDTATVNVTNVAPSATFNAPATAFAGFPFTISLTNPSDPSAADTAAGFTYAFDCGDGSGYGAFGSSSSATCPTSSTGSRTVRGTIRDKDGGAREYTAVVQVVVTFDSLCDLVRAYTDDQQVADQLCQRLEQAEKASNAVAKNAHLASFRDRVDKSGAFTDAEAATLKQLSTEL